MTNDEFFKVVRGTKYSVEAFLFVQRGLDFTVRRIHGPRKKNQEVGSSHVSGQDLCYGLRDYAIKEYGLLARSVLKHWKITSCDDFGKIVFALIEAGIMHKTDEDTLRDFAGVYEFADVFAPQLQLSENA